jgi:hypothetical protein
MKTYSYYLIDLKVFKYNDDFIEMNFLRQKKVPTTTGTFHFNFFTLFFYECGG